jgi:hypothetical protein
MTQGVNRPALYFFVFNCKFPAFLLSIVDVIQFSRVTFVIGGVATGRQGM